MHQTKPKIDEYLERVYRISKSFETKRAYNVTLNKFIKFLNSKNQELAEILFELKNKQKDPIILLDEFYSYMSKQNLRNSTITTYLCIVKDYLNFHDMHIYTEDVKQKFRTPKREVFYEEGLTKAILNRLLHNSSPKLQVVILLACTSGMRIGEMMQLRRSDIDFTTNPTTIRIRRETTKTRETRLTHTTTEASKILSDYITKRISQIKLADPYLFMYHEGEFGTLEYHKKMYAARQTMLAKLRHTIRSIPELAMKNENGKYSIHFHAFRKWFKTQVTNAQQSDFAEALMGHKSLKLVYYKQSTQERQNMYKKLEPYLTISDFTRVEKTIDELKDQVEFLSTELEKVKQWREISVKYQRKKSI